MKAACTTNQISDTLKESINALFDNTKKKKSYLSEDFFEDCSLYIREDQVELLKSLYQIMVEHQAFDDDEDLEEGYEEESPENLQLSSALNIKSGNERREESLVNAEEYEMLLPLIEELRSDKTAIEKKATLWEFVEYLKDNKGLNIDFSGNSSEDTMYGKLPLKEWTYQ